VSVGGGLRLLLEAFIIHPAGPGARNYLCRRLDGDGGRIDRQSFRGSEDPDTPGGEIHQLNVRSEYTICMFIIAMT